MVCKQWTDTRCFFFCENPVIYDATNSLYYTVQCRLQPLVWYMCRQPFVVTLYVQ